MAREENDSILPANDFTEISRRLAARLRRAKIGEMVVFKNHQATTVFCRNEQGQCFSASLHRRALTDPEKKALERTGLSAHDIFQEERKQYSLIHRHSMGDEPPPLEAAAAIALIQEKMAAWQEQHPAPVKPSVFGFWGLFAKRGQTQKAPTLSSATSGESLTREAGRTPQKKG